MDSSDVLLSPNQFYQLVRFCIIPVRVPYIILTLELSKQEEVLVPKMPDEDEGCEDGGEKLVEQVDRRVGKQQAQLIHNLGSKMAHKTGFKTSW